jgi:hypothetical protein
MRTSRLLAALLVIVMCSASVIAKAPTAKLLLWGDGIAGMVEIVDPGTLAVSNIFAANFLDTTRHAAPAPRGLPEYEVSFYLPDDRGFLRRVFTRPRLERAYVVYVALDTTRHTAYVYLPGPGDLWTAWNRSTIVRDEQEGRWNYASAEWTARVAGAIAGARKLPPPACPSGVGLPPTDSIAREAAALVRVLERRGMHVLCAHQSMADGMLSQRAVTIVTSLGPFDALFFPSDADARGVAITGSVRDGQAITVLRGGNPRWRVDTLGGAEPRSIITRGRWLFDTFGQFALEASLRSALNGI